MKTCRKPYPSDVSDEEWELIVPYLTLQREDAGRREHSLREVFNGLCYIVKTGAPWRWMPNDLPPWAAVYQQHEGIVIVLQLAEEGRDLVVRPFWVALGRPAVEVFGQAPREQRAVERARSADDAAAWVGLHVALAQCGQGAPVERMAGHHRPEQCAIAQLGRESLGPHDTRTGLEQQHRARGILRQSRSQRCPGGTSADHDHIVGRPFRQSL